jgi:hypothetical protein
MATLSEFDNPWYKARADRKAAQRQGIADGCGKKIDPETEFTDELSKRMWPRLGLCQACQKKRFNEK